MATAFGRGHSVLKKSTTAAVAPNRRCRPSLPAQSVHPMRNNDISDHVARAKATPIQSVITERGIKLRGRIERVGPCPVCGGDDRFSINTKKQLWNCRGCNVGGDVIALVQHLDKSDFKSACETLAGPIPGKTNGKAKDSAREIVTATFEYHDASGRLLFVKDRIQFQNPDGSFALKDGKPTKSFRQRRPDPDQPGQWLHNVTGVLVVPYRLPQVLEAVAANVPVVVVEGEAKADLLGSWGIAATCNAGGAKKWKAEHSEFLRGADVVLMPDHDDIGWAHANAVAASLVGIAKSIRVVVLPHAKAKDDVIDWAKNGGTREQLAALLEQAQEWQPPPAEEVDEKAKAKATAEEDELIANLARMRPGIAFARARSEAAKSLGLPRGDIDAEIRRAREDIAAAPLYGHWVVEPWPEPVDGDSLLRDLIRRIRRHVVISDEGVLTVGLWVIMSWVHDEVATHSPILNINSVEPESGKSTLMGLIAFLMPKCIASVEISEAALYRAIERWQPSLALDEFDSILTDDNKAALRSVINSGHVRGSGVLRCTGDDQTPTLFQTFAAKSIGMIGRRLPPPTLSRCIFIELRRRRRDELVEKFKHTDDAGLADLRGRLRRWALDNRDALRDAKPSIPDALQNRAEDNWRLLLGIGDLCSGVEDYADKARTAAIRIESRSDSRTASALALAAVKAVFEARGCDRIYSETLLNDLTADPTAEWAEWGRSRKPISQRQLANLLRGYGITPEQVRIDDVQRRGYVLTRFQDAFERYL